MAVFKAPPAFWLDKTLLLLGKFTCNPIYFETYLKRNCKYVEKDGESIYNWMIVNYGIDVTAMFRYSIKGHSRLEELKRQQNETTSGL
jgi:hypothetical protein